MKKSILLSASVILGMLNLVANGRSEDDAGKNDLLEDWQNPQQDGEDELAMNSDVHEEELKSEEDASNLSFNGDDDADISSMSAREIEEISRRSPVLEKQAEIIASSQKPSMPMKTLIRISNDKLCVTADTLEDFEKNPESAVVRLDLYDGVNLFILLGNVLDNVLRKHDGESVKKIREAVAKNERLSELLSELRDVLARLSDFGYVNFEDDDFSSTYATLLKIVQEINSILQKAKLPAAENFVNLLELSYRFINLLFVRYHTELMLSKIRKALEGIQSKTGSASASMSVSIDVPIPGLKANIDLSHAESLGTSASSFYTITKSSGGKAGVTYSISLAKIFTKVGLEQASQEIHYSLESVLDAYDGASKFTKQLLNSKNGMKTAAADRADMQQKERQLLKEMTAFGSHLKAFGALPQNVTLKWLDVTKSSSSERTNEVGVSAEVGANLDAAVNIGLTFKTSKSRKMYSKEYPILRLINNDCSLANGVVESDAIKTIGEEFNLSNKVFDLRWLLSDMISYNLIIGNLANESVSAEDRKLLTVKKHKIEDRWLPKKTFGRYGREGMLKSFLLTSIILAKTAGPNYAIICKKIYEQLCVLTKLCEFSKNNAGVQKIFQHGTKSLIKSSVNAYVTTNQISFAMQMPLIGSANVLLTRQTVTGSPFLEENGKSVTLKFTLPIASGGAIGMYLLRKTMGNLLNKNMKAGVDTKDFAEIAKVFCTDIGVVGSSFLQQTIANSITGLSVSGTSDFKITWCISDPINDLKSLAPLPGMKLVNAQKRLPWRLDFITITNNLNAGLNSPGSLMGLELPASLKVAISRGDVLKITGPNTLHDLTSKYNALSLGTLDGKSKKSTAIDSLLSGQSTQILKICRNIGRGDTNAAFELQVMYNDILKKMPNEKKKSFQKMMADFIANCQKLNKISAEKVKKSSLSKKELSEINENAAVRSDAFAGAKSTASAAGQKDTDESEKTLATENVSQEMAENTGLLDIIDAIGDKPIKAEPLDRDDVRKAIDHIEQLLAAYFLYVFLPHYNQKHSASTGVLADEQSVNF